MKVLVVSSNNTFLNGILQEWEQKKVKIIQIHFLSVKGNAVVHLLNAMKNSYIRLKMWRLAKKVDIIWCEWEVSAYELLRKNVKTPIVVRIHTPFSTYIPKIDFPRITKTFTISTTAKRDLKPYVNATVVPNAIKHEFFDYPNNREFHKVNFCSVANFIPQKRLYDLVLTVEQLRADLKKDFILTLVGKGSDYPYLKLLEKRLEWLTIIDWVDDLKELREFFRTQDFFISHSSYESFGVAMIEAALQGAIPLQHDKIIEHGVLPSNEYYYSNYNELKEKIAKFVGMTQQEYEHRILKLRDYFQSYHPNNVANMLLTELKNILQDTNE